MNTKRNFEKEIHFLIKKSAALQEDQMFEQSWLALSEAHILSQPYALLHTVVHWEMLKASIRQGDWQEFFGQLLRLVMAAPGSLLEKYPIGNTGRSSVSMFKPMPIPDEIQSKIEKLK